MRLSTLFFASLAALCAVSSLSAQTFSLDAVADHSGLVRNNGNAVGQYGRADTLWGTANGTIGQRRNGLLQFQSLDAATRSGLIDGSLLLDSVTIELWNTDNGWNETTLLFSRLNDGNADWATLAGADTGGNGVSSWSDKIESDGTDWSGSEGAGNNTVGTAGQQVFGSLTSSNAGGTALGANKFEVSLAGSELLDWLTSDTIAPNLLVTWDSSAGNANAQQTRFATINTADTDDEFAPNLVVSVSAVPEPGSFAILGLVGVVCGLRRRR